MHHNHRTGLLDWTTGLTQTAKYTLRTEAKHTYSLSYFANTAPYSIFPPKFLEVKSHMPFNKLHL